MGKRKWNYSGQMPLFDINGLVPRQRSSGSLEEKAESEVTESIKVDEARVERASKKRPYKQRKTTIVFNYKRFGELLSGEYSGVDPDNVTADTGRYILGLCNLRHVRGKGGVRLTLKEAPDRQIKSIFAGQYKTYKRRQEAQRLDEAQG